MFVTQDLQIFLPQNTADHFPGVKIFAISYNLNVSKYLRGQED